MRISVIGCGWVATTQHGPAVSAYAALQGAAIERAACCDVDHARAEAFRDRFGFRRAYISWQTMLTAERPDVVCLFVPPHLTCELACAILGQGYPLLLEKPPGLTPAEYLAIGEAARKADVPLRVAFNRRYMPLVRALRGCLEAHFQPGDLRYLRYDFTRVGRRDADFSTTAIHGFDTAALLAGSPYQHAHFHYQELPGPGPLAANVYVDALMASGALVRLEFCPLAGLSAERATLHLQDHTFLLKLPQPGSPDEPGSLRHLEKGRLVREWSGSEAADGGESWQINGFYTEDASFFDALSLDRSTAADWIEEFASARQAVALMEAMRQRRAEWSDDGQ